MMAVEEYLWRRGQRGTLYLRRRIPTKLLPAYGGKKEITYSLKTSDLKLAKERLRAELVSLDAQFAQKEQEFERSWASRSAKRIAKLNDEQLQDVARFWVRQTLLHDEQRRQEGLDDEEFDEIDERLSTQRAELGGMLARGKSYGVFPALQGFLHLCGLDYDPDEHEAKRASYVFLRAVVESLDKQLARQRGEVVTTDDVVPDVPLPRLERTPEREATAKEDAGPSWDEVFETWRSYVDNRPKSITIAATTPWRDLKRFVATRGVDRPGAVTAALMAEFVTYMQERGLGVTTLNERLSKIRGIYKIAVGRLILKVNPAADTLGYRENSVRKRQKRRLSFDASDLNAIFGSAIFTEHKRSKGQSGEASYWIPLLMYYTGLRPEEAAGLAVCDLVQDSELGWYLRVEDRPCSEDWELFEKDEVPDSHRRTVKNAASVRLVPVAKELLDLGLLRYVEWLQSRGEVVFFPRLEKDFHGKLSGAFSKFFGRYKRTLGIRDSRKVLYSFRHLMKDLLEVAEVPSKYLQRLLGHVTGDGAVTDGYGSDLPLVHLVAYFARVRFPAIPARSWEPGRGFISLKGSDDRGADE